MRNKIFFMMLEIIIFVFAVGCADNSLEDQTRACTLEYAPVCGVDGVTYGNKCQAGDVQIAYEGECQVDYQRLCAALGGKWIEGANECEGISKEDCEELGGQFDECASACRNNPDAEICTMQCVLVCSFV